MEKTMANKKIWLGMLAFALAFGMPSLAYGQSVNGTWVGEDGMTMTLSNGVMEGFGVVNGMRVPLFRGTYTTKSGNISITTTQLSGTFFSIMGSEMFMLLNIGDDPMKMYSRSELGIRSGMELYFSRAQLEEILDMLYATFDCPIKDNKFNFIAWDFSKR